MSIQTKPGAPALDASDFQLTFVGVTVGVKLRHVSTPDGEFVTSALMCERNASGGWDFKAELAREFMNDLNARGAMPWLRDVLVPAINAWLKVRFSNSKPQSVDLSVPAELAKLDSLMTTLRVSMVDGAPQVSI